MKLSLKINVIATRFTTFYTDLLGIKKKNVSIKEWSTCIGLIVDVFESHRPN